MAASKILVVDDQPINVQLLKRKLEREGLQVAAAYNGKEGLELIRKEKPDLILLDVMMPDMDGIEVCQRLQADEATRSIPVIFITARTNKESKLEGLAVGAVDYITKPIDLDETLARVQTQLRVVTINREMVDLQRRVEGMRRAATIGAVTQGIAHNLNNLLGVVIGHLDLIKVYADKPEDVRRNLNQIEAAVQRIVSIIRQLTSLFHKEDLATGRIGLGQLIQGGIDRFHSDYKLSAPVTVENPLGDLPIETNSDAFEDALSKVLINSWEAYEEAPPEAPRPISIGARILEPDADGIRNLEITVDDQGHGIDPEIRDVLFEPFTSTKRTVGVGMGLTLARNTIQSLGGNITVGDRPGGGTRATLVHPYVEIPEA
jgi:CheY-like chemotaxis protein